MMRNLTSREGCHLATWTKVGKRGDMAPIFISILCMEKGKTSCEYHLLLKCQNILCPGKLENRPVN